MNFGQIFEHLHKTPIRYPYIRHQITSNATGTLGIEHFAKYRFVTRKYREICPSQASSLIECPSQALAMSPAAPSRPMPSQAAFNTAVRKYINNGIYTEGIIEFNPIGSKYTVNAPKHPFLNLRWD